VAVKGETPPLTHRLVYLAEKSELDLNDQQMELLEIVTDFNLEAWYPETIDEAIASLKEAVSLYLEDKKDNCEYQVIGEILLGEDVIHV
jgi:hypothetical protein